MEFLSKDNQYTQMKLYLVKILGIGLSLFIIFTILRGQFSVPLQRGTILMLGTVIIFLSRPGSAFLKSRFARLDELLSWLGIAAIIGSVFYIYVEWFEIAEYRPGAPTVYDLLIYSVTILVVFEITRRTSGMEVRNTGKVASFTMDIRITGAN